MYQAIQVCMMDRPSPENSITHTHTKSLVHIFPTFNLLI